MVDRIVPFGLNERYMAGANLPRAIDSRTKLQTRAPSSN